ncbi:hypothetical protein PVK06_024542 [Gossypium arboreum]|uniref:Uncharacterized protein n=1 Tax=Gossypium arboreum TaxID=29729 RepID=A0ABR0PEF2_GOSAR|nr:hypothetical protein PVK06_024542 [Gossypium arboreum]
MFFANTLKAQFINHMLGSATKSFSDIVMSGEMIENVIRSGKIYAGEMLKDVDLIIQDSEEGPKGVKSYCKFHAAEGHEIQKYVEFRALVQSLMDNKKLEFFEDIEGLEGKDVCASEEGTEEENLLRICPYIPGSILNNWIVEEILVVFRTISTSPYINYTSDTTANLESPFKQYMCLEEPQDFEDDGDCNLSLDLLRMVDQDEKQILPYKESVEMSLGDKQEKKEVKIRTCITI